MSENDSINASSSTARGGHRFGLAGVVIAFLGLSVAVVHPLFADLWEPPPKDAADVVVEAGKKLAGKLVQKVKRAQPAPPPNRVSWPTVFAIAAASAGLAGVGLGAVSWIRREDHRLSAAAVAVGLLAVAWHYIVAAIVVAVVLAVLALILSAVGT